MNPPIGAEQLAQIKGVLADLEPGPAKLPPPSEPVVEPAPAVPDPAASESVQEPVIAPADQQSVPFGGDEEQEVPFGPVQTPESDDLPFAPAPEADQDSTPFGAAPFAPEPAPSPEDAPFAPAPELDDAPAAPESPLAAPGIDQVPFAAEQVSEPTVEYDARSEPAPFDPQAPITAPLPPDQEEAPVEDSGPFAGLTAQPAAAPSGPVADQGPFAEQPEPTADPAPFAADNDFSAPTPTAGEPAPMATGPDPLDSGPVDLLYAIAQQGEHQAGAAAETVREARQEARKNRPQKGLLQKSASKVKFEALPFDSIVPGHPLIIASYSPSGGVGKSSTAMNLGICMATVAQNMAKQKGPDARVPRVLTLDGDIVMGSLSLRLTSKISPNLYDLQKYIDDRKAAGFEGEAAWPSSFDAAPPGEEPMYKFTHWPDNPSNFNVLAAPSDPKHFWHFGPAHYKELLKMLGKFYDVIIIDCGTEMVLDSQRAWLSHANEVFLITSPDSDRLYNCSKAARHIASSSPHPQDRRGENAKLLPPLATREKISLVITRADSDSGLVLDKVVDTLFPWLDDSNKFWIPDVSSEITKANNTGHFLVTENQDYAKVINQMAKHAFHRYVTARSQHGLPEASAV